MIIILLSICADLETYNNEEDNLLKEVAMAISVFIINCKIIGNILMKYHI